MRFRSSILLRKRMKLVARTKQDRTVIQHQILRRMANARRYNAWLVDRARPFLGDRVIDVGAGIGTFTELLARSCREVVALEPDPASASMLRQRFGDTDHVRVVEGTLGDVDTTFASTFDSAVCFNVLEHIRDDDRELARLRVVLRPSGHLLLLVPAHPVLFGSLDGVLEHERRYRRRDLQSLIEDANFDVKVLRHVNPVGALGWFVSSRLLRTQHISPYPLALYDAVLPVLRPLDRLRIPVGLSLWAVASPSAG